MNGRKAFRIYLSRNHQTVDRKSTRLNSSHVSISYAVFCLKKKNIIDLRGYRIKHQLDDILTFNQRAIRGALHISAISIHAYTLFSDKYLLLPCGTTLCDV